MALPCFDPAFVETASSPFVGGVGWDACPIDMDIKPLHMDAKHFISEGRKWPCTALKAAKHVLVNGCSIDQLRDPPTHGHSSLSDQTMGQASHNVTL